MQAGTLKFAGATVALAAFVAGCSDSATNTSAVPSTLEPKNYVVTPATNGTLWACKFTVDAQGNIINDASRGSITASLTSGAGAVNAGPQTIFWPSASSAEPQCVKVWEGSGAATVAVTETPAAGSALSFYKLATPTDQNPQTRIYVNGDQSPSPAGATVNVNVDGSGQWEIWFKNTPYTPVQTGCTLTIGYWQTHSKYGPAKKTDATWDQVQPSGADSPFYNSGKTWIEMIKSSPNGSAYIILARQFIGATLNKLAGTATTPDVDAALAAADSYFKGQTTPTRAQILAWATLLDNYNNGLVGPGHCGDEATR